MTLGFERRSAIKRTRDFLHDLLDAKKTQRVPRRFRLQARSLLKHFPSEFDFDLAEKSLKKTKAWKRLFGDEI